MDLLLFLTNDIGSHIVARWLDVGDVLVLDTAYCSRSAQTQLRALLSNCVVENNGGRGFPVDGNGMKWFIARNMSAANVQMSLGELLSNGAELAFLFLKHFAPKLQRIRFDTSGFYLKQNYDCHKFLESFAKSCEHLTHLTIGLLPQGLSTPFLRNLAAHCPHLSSLSLIYFEMFADNVACDAPFASLRSLSVRFLIDPDTVCLPYLIRCSPQLEKVRITGACRLSSECITALSTTNAPVHSVALFGVSLSDSAKQILQNRAPTLLSITIGGQYIAALCITDVFVIGLVQSACLLQELRLLCPNSVTDASLVDVAAHCPYLQHLHIIHSNFITNVGVKVFAKKCQHLRSAQFQLCRMLSVNVLFFFAAGVSVEYSAYVCSDVYSPPPSPTYAFPYASIPADGMGTTVHMPITMGTG